MDQPAVVLHELRLLGEPFETLALVGDWDWDGSISAAVEALVFDAAWFQARWDSLRLDTTLDRKTDSAAVDPPRLRVRAKDLIAEVHMISAEVQRIMFQVEKAFARLATSG